MLAQGAGAIVNVSSLASIQINGYPYFGYCAKAGLNHFTRALGRALRAAWHPRQCGAAEIAGAHQLNGRYARLPPRGEPDG